MSGVQAKYGVAKRVLAKLGGIPHVADKLGLTRVTLYRWQYPRSRGGTDGLIPSEHHHDLMRIAEASGVSLSAEDFFDRVSPATTTTDQGQKTHVTV